MGCSSGKPAAVASPSDPKSGGADLPPADTADAPPKSADDLAAIHLTSDDDAAPRSKQRSERRAQYPERLRVTFQAQELLAAGGLSRLLGEKFAAECARLAAELGVEASALAEAFGDPRMYDAHGNEIDSFENVHWPVALEFPRKARKHNLVLGLQGAGKSAILTRLHTNAGGDLETSGDEPGVETLELGDGTCFSAWRLPCTDSAARQDLFANALSLIFVLDAGDREQLKLAREQLELVGKEDCLAGLPLLVFSNKQDLPGAMQAAEVTESLGLSGLRRRCLVQSLCATSGDGFFQGITWLTTALSGPPPAAKRASVNQEGDDVAEIILQCVQADGVDFGTVLPEHSALAFPVRGGELLVSVGRQEQPGFFERLVLTREHLLSISREHVRLSLSRTDGKLWLTRLSPNLVSVGELAVDMEATVPVLPGAKIAFASPFESQPPFLVMDVAFRTRNAVAAEGAHPAAGITHNLSAGVPPLPTESTSRPAAVLVCTHAAGCRLDALPSCSKELSLCLDVPLEIGRSQQPGFFELLLQADGQWLTYISRTHCRLLLARQQESAEVQLVVENLSSNAIVVGEEGTLKKDRCRALDVGGELGFVAAANGGETVFLRFSLRLVAADSTAKSRNLDL